MDKLVEPEHVREGYRGQVTGDSRKQHQVARTPPSNIELEMCILGGIMLEPEEGYPAAASLLTPDMFYIDGHGTIFEVMGGLHARGIPPDQKSVLDELRSRQTGDGGVLLDKVGGAGILLSCLNSVASAASLEYHAAQVADKAHKRALIRAATQVIEQCYLQQQPLSQVIDEVYQTLLDLSASAAPGGGYDHRDALVAYWAELGKRDALVQRRIEAGEKYPRVVRGIPTTFRDIDAKLRGMRPGQVGIVCGATGMGKSAFIMQVSLALATEHQVPVVLFSLEMSEEELTERLLCMGTHYTDRVTLEISGIGTHQLDSPRLLDAQWAVLTDSYNQQLTAPLRVYCPRKLGVRELRAALQREVRERGCRLAVVDYLGLMDSGLPASAPKYEKVSEVSKGLKAVARELRIPILAAHQLSRAPSGRTDQRPQLSDLRDSGEIEQDASFVIGIYREEYYRKGKPKLLDGAAEGRGLPKAEATVLKNRTGPGGTVEMYWQAEITRFLPAEKL